MESFDLVIIGGGPGGYPAALRAAHLGLRCALVERENLGGTCLNRGCIPTKALLAAAEDLSRFKRAAARGIFSAPTDFHFKNLSRQIRQTIQSLRGGIQAQFRAAGVTLFSGEGRLESPNRVSVRHADGAITLLEADTILLATGSAPYHPTSFPHAPEIMTSDAFLALEALPEKLLIVGGGIIGCEFASLAAAFGVQVTVIEQRPTLLPALHPHIRRVLSKRFQEEKIRILTGETVTGCRVENQHVYARIGEETFDADALLLAIGRKPVTSELNLECTGVRTNQEGAILTDETFQTDEPAIYAIGDLIAHSSNLAHVATKQGCFVADEIAGLAPPKPNNCPPGAIFTLPEIGYAGLSEEDARNAGFDPALAECAFLYNGRAWTLGETEGVAQWIYDQKSSQLLGAQIIGPQAAELIAEASLAIQNRLTINQLTETIHIHPTLSEIWINAAEQREFHS